MSILKKRASYNRANKASYKKRLVIVFYTLLLFLIKMCAIRSENLIFVKKIDLKSPRLQK